MIYIASYVCVSTFFLSKRPLATSISSCGSSAGIFLFGFLYRVCIDHYGWRGALLIFSGLMANGIVCGVLFRPFSNELTSLDNYFAGLDKNSVDFYKNSADLEKRTADLVKADNNNVLIESDMYSVDPDRHTTDADKHSIHSAKLVTASDKLSPTPAIKSFDVHLNEMLSDTTKIDGRKIQHLTDVPAESRTRCDASVDTNKKISLRSYFHDNNHSHQRQNNFDKHSANGNLNSRSDNLDNLENRAGVVCYSSEVTNSPTENQPLVACHREIIGAMTKDPVDSANECPGDTLETKLYLVNKSGRELVTMEQNSTQDLSNKSIQHSRRGSMLTAILGTSNFHIFKDWKFVLYGLSTFLYCSGDGIPFILFPDMAEKNGKKI